MAAKLASLAILPVLLTLPACSQKPDTEREATRLKETLGPSNAFVTFALSAIHTNDFPDAIIALESAKRIPGITAEQLAAIQRAKAAMTADLVGRADRGDPKAQADLAAIERTRSQ
jgi:hypothetical protein